MKKSMICLLLCLVTRFVYAQVSELLHMVVSCPDTVRAGDTIRFSLELAVQDGWYVYSPEPVNREQNMQPADFKFQVISPGLTPIGALQFSPSLSLGASRVYMGPGHILTQKFAVDRNITVNSVNLEGELLFQACNEEHCFPPLTEAFSKTIFVLSQPAKQKHEQEADRDWQELELAQRFFPNEAESTRFKTLSPLEQKRYEDSRSLLKAALAYQFWKKYPADERRTVACKIFLTSDPLFIDVTGNDSLAIFQNWKETGDFRSFVRHLSRDEAASVDWIRRGEEMISAESNRTGMTEEQQEQLMFTLFGRDFRLAARDFDLLPKTTGNELYWAKIGQQYWETFYLRFVAHVHRFSHRPELELRAKDFLTALKGRSPQLAQGYWERLEDLTWPADTLPSGVRLLKETARVHLDLIETEAGKVPLAMQFVSIDGRKIDLQQYQGQVVLIDFWATWCKPCLEELPHLSTLYGKYKDQGLAVIGICFDEESACHRAQEVLKNAHADWPQRFEGTGFHQDAFRLLYGINALPTVWLLDKNGYVVSTKARGAHLEEFIQKQLNSDYVVSVQND